MTKPTVLEPGEARQAETSLPTNGGGVAIVSAPKKVPAEQLALAALSIADDLTDDPLSTKLAARLITEVTHGELNGALVRTLELRGLLRINEGTVIFTGRGTPIARQAATSHGETVRSVVQAIVAPSAPPVPPPPSPTQATSQERKPRPRHVSAETARIMANHLLLENMKAATGASRLLTGAESLAAFAHLYPNRANNTHAARRHNDCLPDLLEQVPKPNRRGYYLWQLTAQGITVANQAKHSMDEKEAQMILDKVPSTPVPEVTTQRATQPERPVPPPAPKVVSEQCPEASELNARILGDLALLEKEKGGDLTDTESVQVIERYVSGRESARQRRSQLVQSGLLKGRQTDSKSGCARWYNACTGPLTTRRFQRNLEVLSRVKPLTPEEARAIAEKTTVVAAAVPAAPVPEPPVAAEEPPPPAVEALATLPAEAPKADHRDLIMRLVHAAEHAQAQIEAARTRLGELTSTRQAILATLADADQAIAAEEAKIAAFSADQAATREAIAALYR